MTARSRPPTDEPTEVYDPERAPRGRPAKPVEIGTPTEVTPPQEHPAGAAHAGATVGASRGAERSEPIRVISLKAPSDGPEERQPVKQHQPRLRRLSEVSLQRRVAATPPGGLGYLAPPRDPREARTRRWRDYLMWGSVAVIVAGAVTLGVWFLARM